MEYKNTGDGSDTSARLYETSVTGPAEIEWLYETSWIDSSYLPGSTSTASSGSSSSASGATASASATGKATAATCGSAPSSSAAAVDSSTTSSSSAVDSSTGPTCTPAAGGSSSTDDTPAIAAAIAECSDGTIVIPAGTTYYLNTALSFEDCTGCTMELEGTLVASDDIDYWATQGAIISISGVTGASIISTTGQGLFDGNGQAAWDEFAASKIARATMLLVAKSSNVVISNIYFKDAPNVFHSCNKDSTNVQYNNITLYAISSSENMAKNTDGWDIGPATYVTINGANVVNDDDCVAFKAGASYVEVYDITCNGSHGLSVGSLAQSNWDTVENIYVKGATMINSGKAVGIKLYPGGADHGTATVSNATWENIVVDDCDYAVQVQSCYNSEEEYCSENPSNATLTDINIINLSGSTSGTDVMNIDCPADGTCGITMSEISVTGSDDGTTYLCANTPDDIGIKCTEGATA